MKTPTFLLLLHLFLLPVFIQCDDNLINQICKKTPFRDLCIASLEPNTNSSAATDVKGLARIITDCVLTNATDTLNYIQDLIKQAPDPQQERALANCAELYIPVVKYELPQAIEALMKGYYGFANYGIADVGKQADACEKGFSGSKKSPLTERNKLVRSLSDIAVAIINILGKNFGKLLAFSVAVSTTESEIQNPSSQFSFLVLAGPLSGFACDFVQDFSQ